MCVGCFLGNGEEWKQVVRVWKEALGPQRKHLHMADLRWKKQRTKELLARLGAVPDKCKLTAVVGGVRQADYDDLIQGTPAEKLLKGYIACIYPLVLNVLRAIPKNKGWGFPYCRSMPRRGRRWENSKSKEKPLTKRKIQHLGGERGQTREGGQRGSCTLSETANRYEPYPSCQTNIRKRSVCPRIRPRIPHNMWRILMGSSVRTSAT